MNLFRWGLFLLFLMPTLFGCAKPAPSFSTYVKPEVDFTRFNSYRWQEVRPETVLMQAQSDLMHRMIVQTIEEELAADGQTKKEKGDLSVTYRVTVSPQKSFWQTLFAADSISPATYNQRSAEAQKGAVDEHKARQGVLVIEMRDRDGIIVWSGRVSAIVSESQPGKAVEAVRRIMAGYPPL